MGLRINPYFAMDGNAKEAIEFYQKALGAEVVSVMTFGDMPQNPPVPDELKGRILHALLKVGGTDLMFSDTMPGMSLRSGDQVTISIQTDSADEARKIFGALAEGGRVTMPIQQTFWSPAYGQLTDKFGVPWQVNTEAKA